jgi:DsbC/DsbD-like thiol-disulfide interchange protein/cytochrome c biogenesis protein CcdA
LLRRFTPRNDDRKMLPRLIFFLALFVLPSLAQAQHIVPQLVAEGPAPVGGEVELAIHMRTQPGWHGYWQNPGDAGLPMSVDWRLPKGFSAGPLRYPVPTRLTVAGLMNYVFEQDYALLVRLKVPNGASGTIPIRAAARWLACTDKICVPEQGELSLDLPVGSGTPNRAQFDAWRHALPQPLATIGHFALDGGKLRVAIPLPASIAADDPYLFPISDGAVDYEAPQSFRRSGDWLIAELKAKKAPAQFDGVIALDAKRGLQLHAVPGAVPGGGTALSGLGWSAMPWAILGALAGGILLNLMPCVFPILALKALHLSKAGEGARAARLDALSYTLGAAAGTGALGIALLAIRAAGAEAGWAFQLQDPRTVMLLLLLAVAITANLLGLFELPVVGGAARPAGSFATGALAAFVATPCAGPFLGAALGTALLLPAAGAVAVFVALGLGLGLPFVLLAIVPALQKRMPKPGRWMDRLKKVLAIPMGLSALAALWLLYRQAGDAGLLFGLIAIIALALCLYFGGRMQRAGRAPARFAFLLAFLVCIPAVARVPASATARLHSVSEANAWSEARVASAVQQGKPLFVYFTADWCLSCKVNETTSIDRSEVRDAFKQAGVTVLVGDWTNGDPAITRFLESRGHAGVPLYLWYAPGKPPAELPQVLTPAMLIDRARALPKR